MATMVPWGHLIHGHPFLFPPLEDLEQTLLSGHLGSGPRYITPDVSTCSLLPKSSNSRYTVILGNTQTLKNFPIYFVFYCLLRVHNATFLLPQILTPHFGEET